MAPETMNMFNADIMGKSPTAANAPSPARAALRGDDKEMLKAAAGMTRDLNAPDAKIFWTDMLGSVVVGYVALAICFTVVSGVTPYLAGIIAVLALYRAGSFIHEISHIKKGDLPYFKLAWNALVGVPLLAPSFMYEGVHNQHHAKTKYGTLEDPEYLPLALMKPWTLPVFLIVGAIAPVMMLGRFAILAPLSLLFPPLRREVVAKYSGLQINPHFRRKPPEGEAARQWHWQEAAASVWSLSLIAAMATGVLPIRTFLIILGVLSGVMFLNQVRTLVAHFWENDGEPMSVTEQYLDSVNVPPPGLLPELWAPVGLRYHALHHLLPGVPYHNLGKAHARLASELGPDSAYHQTTRRGLIRLVGHLLSASWKQR
ncbi:fatty acid desaturase family protein [Sphingomicrobium flavum]|uniref:fatty acid desaturase family protein n=1 Tax=Sphingomicrobium flavum TaxID=1229164 RepID=UPI0028A1D8DA|nr:fatty acid desaturase [Sphingomicrobium flavum]